MADGAVGIGRLSRIQLDLQDHDLVERIMRQHRGVDVSSPEAEDTRLVARSEPSIVITADHWKYGKPNRAASSEDMHHKRHSRKR